jgi:hypothetical protein
LALRKLSVSPKLVVCSAPSFMEETDMAYSTLLASPSQPAPCPAKDLSAAQRQDLAVQALAGTQPITDLADDFQVSRKFVYQQTAKAQAALDVAFAPPTPRPDVLFYLPVTKAWLRQLILALVLCCHSSLRGVQALLADVFDITLSLGTVHNVVHSAVAQARRVNARQDLSPVRVGAHDEIFQNGCPVLVGVDVASTYCYLLSREERRDADTWGVRLLELQDQGLRPDATIADGGQGLRAGQALAWPDIPCRGDVFHALRDVGRLVTYLENRAVGCIAARDQQERRMARAKRKGQGQAHSKRLANLRQAEAQALALADDVALLARWLRDDILAVAGPDHATRCQLLDFVAAELAARQPLCEHRLGPVVRLLRNQRDHLLAFAAQLDQQLTEVAQVQQVAPTDVRDMLRWTALDPSSATYWQREAELRRRLGGRFWAVRAHVTVVAEETVRASSLVENLNSRLRSYFFLRRHLGDDYLELLRFYLNHRRFPRSERPERIGRSPAELLTGAQHPHWLELLGYRRFEQN